MTIRQPLTVILAVLAGNVALSEWLARRGWLAHLGSALLVIVITAVMANLGVIPTFGTGSPVYDGITQTDLLAGSDSLAVGAIETITFTVRITLGDATGPFANQAFVSTADEPGGDPTDTDPSDEGDDPDPDGDGDPGGDPEACEIDPEDPACEDTPTDVDVPDFEDPVLPGLNLRALRQGRRDTAERNDAVLPEIAVRGRQAIRLLDDGELPRVL